MAIDNIDKKILNIIQEHAKLSYYKIGKELGLAASTVHSRVRKLEKAGVIRNFSAIVNPDKVGYEIIAVIGLSVDPAKLNDVASKLTSYEETQLVATTSGDHDMIVQAIAKDIKSLWRFINEKIKTNEGIKPEMDVSGFIDLYKMTHFIKFQEKTE